MHQTPEDLEKELAEVKAERNKYHAELTDLRLKTLEGGFQDHENRIRPLEAGQIKASTIYTLFTGNTLLVVIALVKIFASTPTTTP